jgi:Leucine-rich repeat (LRR) protein
LYLQQNALSELGVGLAAQVRLRTLVLAQNMLASLQGLQHLTVLENLDISSNCLSTLDGLQALGPRLKTLSASNNRMRTAADIAALRSCTSLNSLDIASCRLVAEPIGKVGPRRSEAGSSGDGSGAIAPAALELEAGASKAPNHVLALLSALPLSYLRLQGNALVSATS